MLMSVDPSSDSEVKHKFGGCVACLHSLLWRLALLYGLCCLLVALGTLTCYRTALARFPGCIMNKQSGELVPKVASSEGASHEVTVLTFAFMLAERVAYDLRTCPAQVLHPLKVDA